MFGVFCSFSFQDVGPVRRMPDSPTSLSFLLMTCDGMNMEQQAMLTSKLQILIALPGKGHSSKMRLPQHLFAPRAGLVFLPDSMLTPTASQTILPNSRIQGGVNHHSPCATCQGRQFRIRCCPISWEMSEAGGFVRLVQYCL